MESSTTSSTAVTFSAGLVNPTGSHAPLTGHRSLFAAAPWEILSCILVDLHPREVHRFRAVLRRFRDELNGGAIDLRFAAANVQRACPTRTEIESLDLDWARALPSYRRAAVLFGLGVNPRSTDLCLTRQEDVEDLFGFWLYNLEQIRFVYSKIGTESMLSASDEEGPVLQISATMTARSARVWDAVVNFPWPRDRGTLPISIEIVPDIDDYWQKPVRTVVGIPDDSSNKVEILPRVLAALESLPYLHAFTWRRRRGLTTREFNALFDRLSRLVVSRIRLVDLEQSLSHSTTSMLDSPAFFNLRELSHFEIASTNLSGDDEDLDFARVEKLIQFLSVNGESLLSLHLHFTLPDSDVEISQILSQITFPQLRDVSFVGCSCDQLVLLGFLRRHPKLCSLSIPKDMHISFTTASTLPASAWPKFQHLEHLNATSPTASALLSFPGVAPKLWMLAGIDFLEHHDPELHGDTFEEQAVTTKERMLTVLSSRGQSITHISLLAAASPDALTDIQLLATRLPRLTYLNIGRISCRAGLEAWLTVLPLLPGLATIHGWPVQTAAEAYPPHPDAEAVVLCAAAAAPSLRLWSYGQWDLRVSRHDGHVTVRTEERGTWSGRRFGSQSDGTFWPSDSWGRAALRRLGGAAVPSLGWRTVDWAEIRVSLAS
ncbi:hypothetical protein HK405_007724 [Cladochytrium tenue]|nr:hypothetical protein HK405_007724 [Cladochytrium tenue]